jgi:hypothetical protein
MSEYDNLPLCECGGEVFRKLCAPAVHGDITPYISPGTNTLIDSRAKQREDLLKSNSIINEPGLKQDISRWKTEKAEKDFSPIAAAVDAKVSQLVSSGKIESL